MGTMDSQGDSVGESVQMALVPAITEFNRDYVRAKPGRTLIVGSKVYKHRADRRKLYKDSVGLDLAPGEGVDCVWDLEQSPPHALGIFDHVECWSVLEHCQRPWLVAANIQRLMTNGSTIHIFVPFIWDVHAYPNDYWRMTTAAIPVIFPLIRWKHLKYANIHLVDEGKTPMIRKDEHKYLARTETCAFGEMP